MKNSRSPIVLMTDFGHKDPFAGVIKGVIYSINPDAGIIDLTHGINAQDILQASFLLYTSYAYFPSDSIFCTVVDPGVGSDRKPICIRTQNYYFIGPDNGVLWMSAKKDGIRQIIHLSNSAFFLEKISTTFHGRDIFAPVAAHISLGSQNLSELGPPLDKCIEYEMPKAVVFNDQMTLTVINIDRFGNITLNLTQEDFDAFVRSNSFIVSYHDARITKRCNSYSEASTGEPVLISSSSSFMEICVKNDSAAEFLNARSLDNLLLTFRK